MGKSGLKFNLKAFEYDECNMHKKYESKLRTQWNFNYLTII